MRASDALLFGLSALFAYASLAALLHWWSVRRLIFEASEICKGEA